MMDLGKLLLKRVAREKAAAAAPDAGAAEEKLEKQARLYFERATSLNPVLATDVQAVLVPAE